MCLVALHVDPKNFVIEPKTECKSLVLNSVLPAIVQCHILYAMYRFITAASAEGMNAIATATVDYAVIMFGELGIYAVFEGFVRTPAVTRLLCKNLVLEEAKCISRSRKGAFRGYSLTEMCTMIFPAGVFPAVAIVSFMYGTLYLWTGTDDCDSGRCILSFLVEFCVNFSWMSFCYCIGLLQIVFLQKISHDLQIQAENLR